MGRKTIDVVYVLESLNSQLARTDLSDVEKRILCDVLEDVLHKTDNYSGFNHRYWASVGYRQWVDAGGPGFPEKEKFILGPSGQEHNRFYYYSTEMQEVSRRARLEQVEVAR